MSKLSEKGQSRELKSANVQTLRDAKNAFLVVSILINAFILIGWAVLKLTSQYDTSLASTLLGR